MDPSSMTEDSCEGDVKLVSVDLGDVVSAKVGPIFYGKIAADHHEFGCKLASAQVAKGLVGAEVGPSYLGGTSDGNGRKGLIADVNLAKANIGGVSANIGLSSSVAVQASDGTVGFEVLETGVSLGMNTKISILGSSVGINLWKPFG